MGPGFESQRDHNNITKLKIVCVSKSSSRTHEFNHITLNKVYDGSIYDSKTWMIRDDSGEVALYPKKNFKPIEEARDRILNKLVG